MQYTEEEIIQDIAKGILLDMENMLELANGKPKARTELPADYKTEPSVQE